MGVITVIVLIVCSLAVAINQQSYVEPKLKLLVYKAPLRERHPVALILGLIGGAWLLAVWFGG